MTAAFTQPGVHLLAELCISNVPEESGDGGGGVGGDDGGDGVHLGEGAVEEEAETCGRNVINSFGKYVTLTKYA